MSHIKGGGGGRRSVTRGGGILISVTSHFKNSIKGDITCINQIETILLKSIEHCTLNNNRYTRNDIQSSLIRNVLKRRRECGTYLATARRHCRRLKMQKRDE